MISPEEYIEQRLSDQIGWYDRKSSCCSLTPLLIVNRNRQSPKAQNVVLCGKADSVFKKIRFSK
jgi:hypothetical protein